MEKQLDQILPIYQEWGIKGLKYGFVNVGSRQWTGWLHEAVRKAAKYELMVDIHDEYRPTGYSRTYPNLMTQEGIRGDEESPSTEHTLTTLFTRMLAGAGDNTNCYLAPRVVEKMGGKTAQMAKAIMIYSPWQFLYWYDRPADSPHKTGGAGSAETLLKENPELSFYDALPTVWDDIKVIEGEIGEFATIARRSGTEWFIGSLAANNNRTIEIPLSFLDSDKKYIATVYSQNSSGLKNNKAEISEITVTAESVLSREIIRNSGIAIIIREI
jgi:alpha-glucosidase